ncbi:unnamed protein product [Linum trigynum]|uniref:Uncharacterized protein n=1 Tax=Linum trigynum TaxID=586398 RepID=A0AAV2EMJ3_9ROSI
MIYKRLFISPSVVAKSGSMFMASSFNTLTTCSVPPTCIAPSPVSPATRTHGWWHSISRARYLYGPIPGDIGLLTHLVNLTIVYAGVTAPLPAEMANLEKLSTRQRKR